MQILKDTDSLRLVTTAAGATLDVTVTEVEKTSDTATLADRKPTAISGTTGSPNTITNAVTSGKQKIIKKITIANTHASISQTCTLQLYNGSTAYVIGPNAFTLLAGEFVLIDGNGVLFVYDANGILKTGTTGFSPNTNTFRLSGVSATPIMTADSTTLSTLYLANYNGNEIALYDGTNWQLCRPAAEPSLAVTGRTADLPFDVFAYNNAGTVTLEMLDWTNSTTRATGLTRVSGVWTKTGDATRRYLGSVRARSATTFHWVRAGVDLPAKFDLFNADNRVDMNFSVIATTNSWNYTTATIRQAQASANYQLDIMVGLQEESCDVTLVVASTNSTISIPRNAAIGFDSTTAFSGVFAGTSNTVASIECEQTSRLCNMPTIGRHYYAWLEISTATGTCTWYGDNGALRIQSGMTGIWTC